MTEDAYAFVSGPRMVETSPARPLDADELGGAGVHAASTGVAAARGAPTRDAALDALGDLLAYLPSNIDEEPPRWSDRRPGRPADARGRRAASRPPPPAATTCATSPGAIVDDGELLELRARWAPNLVTAFATIGGRPVGIVANQPHVDRRHARHPGLAEGRPLRRRSATPSTCRCSPSSTRPASTRARTSSGGA